VPEPAVSGRTAYFGRTDDEAAKTLAKLPTTAQLAWIKVQPQLLGDPVGSARIRKLSRDGRVFLYSQSDPPLEVMYEVDNDNGTIDFLHFSAPQLQARNKLIVVVYNDKDKEWFDSLLKWIGALQDSGLIEVWDVSQIAAGTNRQAEIAAALKRARAVLLLVTQELVNTEFKNDEFRLDALLKEGEVGVHWIAVKTSMYKWTAIKSIMPLNNAKKPLAQFSGAARDEAFLAVSEALEKIVQEW
jgi:hypothetical protein